MQWFYEHFLTVENFILRSNLSIIFKRDNSLLNGMLLSGRVDYMKGYPVKYGMSLSMCDHSKRIPKTNYTGHIPKYTH